MKLAQNDALIKRLLKTGAISVSKNGIVKGQKKDIHGYLVIHYRGKNLKCHRIAYQHFFGNLKRNMQVNHKNGNKLDNSKKNLELVTHSENIRHMHATIKRAKLTKRKAENIRNFYATGAFTQRLLAKRYGCSTRLVQLIINGERHV